MDTSYEPEFVFVDEFTCIGCRNCNNVCSATFMMEEEWGRARVRQQGVDGVDSLQEAIDTCPVSCIHWVTAPQLALLEETMSRMERVAAWLLVCVVVVGGRDGRLPGACPGNWLSSVRLPPVQSIVWRCAWADFLARDPVEPPTRSPLPPQMTGGGKGANLSVFVEAATAWEKRQAALRAKVQAEQGWGFFRAGPATGSSMQDAARLGAASTPPRWRRLRGAGETTSAPSGAAISACCPPAAQLASR
jgi:ferredoxin